VQHRHSKVVSTKGKKEMEFLTSAERGNKITVVICRNAFGTYVPPLTVFPRKNMKEGVYGWSTGVLNFGLQSKWLESDGYIY
jgi:hypothetical protein